MQESNCFDSVTGFDMSHSITGASIPVLDMVILLREEIDHTEISKLLPKMAMITDKHLRNRRIPSIFHKWATLISDLPVMTQKFRASNEKMQCNVLARQ